MSSNDPAEAEAVAAATTASGGAAITVPGEVRDGGAVTAAVRGHRNLHPNP